MKKQGSKRSNSKKTELMKRYEKCCPELIVLPSMTNLGSGAPVNINDTKLLGPLLSLENANLKKAKIYLMDGTYLGELGGLMV